MAAPKIIPRSWYLPDRRPLFWHECRRHARGRLAHLLLALYVVGLIVASLIVTYIAQMHHYDFDDAPYIGQRLFWISMAGQMALMIFLTINTTTTAIASEQVQGTLEALVLTPLSPQEIIRGKLQAIYVQIGLFILAGIPVIATFAFAYGGVSPLELVIGYMLLIYAGAFCAAHGLLISCQSRTPTEALVKGYLLVVPGVLIALMVFITVIGAIVVLIDIRLTFSRCLDYIELLRYPAEK